MTSLQSSGKFGSAAMDMPKIGGQRCEEGVSDELFVQSIFLDLRTLNDGLLLPWIAPAIRGLVLKPLRDHVCSEMGGRELIRAAGLADWREQPST